MGTLAFVPFLVIFVLKIVFAANAIRPDQLQPPKEIVSIEAVAPAVAAPSKPAPDYPDFVAAGPNRTAAAFLTKYMPEFTEKKRTIWTGWQAPGYLNAPRFSADLVSRQWLLDHAEFVNDLIGLAKAGGLPTTTAEQAFGFMLQGIRFFPRPDNSMLPRHSFTRTLIAESRRRRDSGDPAGAAEALAATYVLEHSTSEPYLSDIYSAAYNQTEAHRELAAWIEDGGIQPDLARRIRASIMATSTTLEHYRRLVELDCLDTRMRLIDHINSPLGDIYGRKLGSLLNKKAIQDANVAYAAGAYVGFMAQSAYTAVMTKSTASRKVEQFDADVKALLKCVENDELSPPVAKELFGFNESEGRMRIKTNLAFMSVNIAALDMITSSSPTMLDPFTRRPLLRVDDTSGTLIYSVGPDMKDQHGAISSENIPESDDPCDIAVRIPRRGK
ncbi:MAG: hypothetical protein ABFD69_01700 [Candidatus Sumerlaeia bacterium]